MSYIGNKPTDYVSPVLLSLASGIINQEFTSTSTASIQLPQGTTAQQPTAGDGKLRYNTTNGKFEGYSSSMWINFIGDNVANVFTKPQKTTELALTHNTAWDGTDKQHLTVNVNGSAFTVANPSAHTAGTYYIMFVTYTTAHAVSFGSNFKGIAEFASTATAGAYDHLTFRSNGTHLMLVGASYNIGA